MLANQDILSIPGFTEPFSSWSHLLGSVLFAYLGFLLMRKGRGNRPREVFLWVYAFSCVFLMSMSGVYHMLQFGTGGRVVLERLDHGAIFILIAGSFTPAHGILFRGWERWGPLVAIWGAAITGITLKTIFFSDLAEWLGLTFYLGLGWFGAVTAGVLWYRFGLPFIKPLLWGGAVYSIGGIIDFVGWPVLMSGVIEQHELFHLCVLGGAFLHWKFIYQFADGSIPPRVRRNSKPASGAA